jgi:hypothetical protein
LVVKGVQNAPTMRGMLNDFSFLDFLRKITPAVRIMQIHPKRAVNAVSTCGKCGTSNPN